MQNSIYSNHDDILHRNHIGRSDNVSIGSTTLLTPKIDVVFHSLFRTHNEDLTSKFLSAILGHKVQVIDMSKDRHVLKEYPNSKLGILDLITTLEDGSFCNIEIQLVNEGDIINRCLYYWSRIFGSQLSEGSHYKTLRKTISILIVDFELKELKQIKELGSKCHILFDNHPQSMLTDKLEFCILELPKAKKILEKDPNNKIAQWLAFLDNPNCKEVSESMVKNQEIKEAMEQLKKISSNPELRRIIELKQKHLHDEAQAKVFYEERGLMRGLKKGIKKGREQGIEQGREQGIFKNQLEVVKRMLKNGFNIETISKITELPISQIKEIQKSL